ncbi:MAG: hypothetical protein CMJ46_03285 [Planctomyces sp.]|nr:hypothetical protein [Planctomyces sp.]
MKLQVELKNDLSPATPAETEEFERKWNVQFPDEYRQFLREYNGGHIKENNYIRMTSEETTFVSWLFGIGLENGFSLEEQSREFERILPEGTLPVAIGIGHHLFSPRYLYVMELAGGNAGAIYVLNPDSDTHQLRRIANSFTMFVESIKQLWVVGDLSRFRSLNQVDELLKLTVQRHWAPFDTPIYIAQCVDQENVREHLERISREMRWNYVEFALTHAWFEDLNPQRYYPRGDLTQAARLSHLTPEGNFTAAYLSGIDALKEVIASRYFPAYNPYRRFQLPLRKTEEYRKRIPAN